MTLTVPKRAHPGLRRILAFDDRMFGDLIETISKLGPSPSLQDISKKIASTKILSLDAVREIIFALGPLYTVRTASGSSVGDFVLEVCRAMQESGAEDFSDAKVNYKDFQARLNRLLSLDQSLGITAKAQDVLAEYEHAFCSVRILTDLRPLFAEIIGPPITMAVIHNLKIAYHEGQELKEFYVAMDENDVKTLRVTLERAEEKAKSLRNALKSVNLISLDAE